MEDSGKFTKPLARLHAFNQQISYADTSQIWDAPQITFEENIIGQQDIREPMLSQCAFEETLIQKLVTMTLEAMPARMSKINVMVLIDSVEFETGFLVDSVSEIAKSYNREFFESFGSRKIKAAQLKQDRQFIRDHGSVIGLLSRGVPEFKLCCAAYLNRGEFHQESVNKKLMRLHRWLQNEGEVQHQNFFVPLALLANKQFQRNARRELTPAMTKRLLDCDSNTAEILCHAYQQLPRTPLII